MDNDTIRDVKKLVFWHDFGIKGNISKKTIRRMLSKMGEEYFEGYIQIRRADIMGQSTFNREASLELLDEMIGYHDEIMQEGNALKISDLAIGGGDLIKEGVKPGPEMGEILRGLLEKVLEEPELNTREILIEIVKNME